MKYIFGYILVIALFLSPAAASAAGWYPVDGPEAARVLVPGDKPLTMGQVHVFFNCIEFAFGLALNRAEQEAVRTAVMQEYLEFKGELLEDMKEVRNLWDNVHNSPPERRGEYRMILRGVFLNEAEKSPNLGLSQMISRIDDQEHEILVSGTPPVTRRSLASFLELVQMALRLRDRRIGSWNESVQQAVEAAILRRIASLPPAGRNWLANADIHQALIMRGWAQVASDERKAIARLLIETFAPAPFSGSDLPLNVDAIPLPPPNLFPLPTELPWAMR